MKLHLYSFKQPVDAAATTPEVLAALEKLGNGYEERRLVVAIDRAEAWAFVNNLPVDVEIPAVGTVKLGIPWFEEVERLDDSEGVVAEDFDETSLSELVSCPSLPHQPAFALRDWVIAFNCAAV